ncbi:hypothetical protein BGZ67_004301, partial [Mortierella alpina]
MEIVDDAAFSFRRKKTTKGSSSPSTAARLPVSQPSSTNSSAPTLDDVIASSLPSPVKAIGLPVTQSPAAQLSSGENASWELVWKGSWIVPSLVPASTGASSSSRKTHASLKRASLES